jgi:hypothetical protein
MSNNLTLNSLQRKNDSDFPLASGKKTFADSGFKDTLAKANNNLFNDKKEQKNQPLNDSNTSQPKTTFKQDAETKKSENFSDQQSSNVFSNEEEVAEEELGPETAEKIELQNLTEENNLEQNTELVNIGFVVPETVLNQDEHAELNEHLEEFAQITPVIEEDQLPNELFFANQMPQGDNSSLEFKDPEAVFTGPTIQNLSILNPHSVGNIETENTPDGLSNVTIENNIDTPVAFIGNKVESAFTHDTNNSIKIVQLTGIKPDSLAQEEDLLQTEIKKDLPPLKNNEPKLPNLISAEATTAEEDSSDNLKETILKEISRVIDSKKLETNPDNSSEFDFSGNNEEFANQSHQPILEEIDFGGLIKIEQGKLFTSFENAAKSLEDVVPHRSEQISLSIKEAISRGKNEISVSLYPEVLGQVDIKIEFAKAGNEQVITSIKILADRAETLKLLGEGVEYLKASIKEVVKTSDNASLSLDLRQGQDSNHNSQEAMDKHENISRDLALGEQENDLTTRQYQVRYSINNDDKVDIRI